MKKEKQLVNLFVSINQNILLKNLQGRRSFHLSEKKQSFDREARTANMGFSAMLAEEYVLIDISLSAAVRAERIMPSDIIYYQLH
jgi:hypothetical protein